MTRACQVALVALVAFSVACGRIDPPTTPTAVTAPPVTVAPPPRPAEYPPVVGPATFFEFSGPLAFPVRGFTRESRYVLYNDGKFALQYLGFEYPGRYETLGDTTLGFEFSSGGHWGAVGTLSGDVLEVRYSPMMQQADFEDAAYKRSR